MLESATSTVAPDILTVLLGLAAAGAAGVGSFFLGRRGRKVVEVDSVTKEKLPKHRHEFARHIGGEVYWRCVVPGCEVVGPRIAGARRTEE